MQSIWGEEKEKNLPEISQWGQIQVEKHYC